jgi:hypothetical protein
MPLALIGVGCNTEVLKEQGLLEFLPSNGLKRHGANWEVGTSSSPMVRKEMGRGAQLTIFISLSYKPGKLYPKGHKS